ncbi:MAG: hypothetical protein WCP03_03330 [Candidatus Saccharibacteria bacterium]
MNKTNFAKGVERLINPISVGTLHFMQYFNQLMPKSIQRKLVKSSAQKTPHMGFVVEPYSLFLCHEIIDIEKAKSLLPDGFELIKTKIFANDEPKYYCIFGCIRAHTSAFWGTRTEFYIIAKDKQTNLLSWIIIDYITDTISYDNKNGLSAPNINQAVMTTDYNGNLIIDIKKKDGSHKLSLTSDVKKGVMTNLDQRLWLEGNLSIGYGKDLSDDGAAIFALKFEPGEVEKALKIPSLGLSLESNTWYPGLFEKEPSQIACFPYAQHFISDSPGHSSKVKNKDDLESAIKSLDFDRVKVFSTKSFRLMILIGTIVSLTITITLLSLLLSK